MTSALTVERPSRDQVLEIIEVGARRRLGISAGELVDRYQSGTLEDSSAVGDLVILLDLLPTDDPIFNGRV